MITDTEYLSELSHKDLLAFAEVMAEFAVLAVVSIDYVREIEMLNAGLSPDEKRLVHEIVDLINEARGVN